MVTAVASTPKHRPTQNTKRLQLLSSDSQNAPPRRPKTREVTSRYLSLSSSSSSSNSSSSTNTTSSSITSGSSVSSRRSQSPMLSSRTVISTPKGQQRAFSAERRRPAATTPSSADRMLVKSVRSLSVSFQGESYSLPVSKMKPPPATVGTPGIFRNCTPERRKEGANPVRDRREKDRENSRPSYQQQHRWPGRLRCDNSSLLSRSLDYGTDRIKWSGSDSTLTDLRKSVIVEYSRNNVSTELNLENKDFEVRAVRKLGSGTGLGGSLDSDVESVSSGSIVSCNAIQLRRGSRGVVVPARFLQDTSSRVQKVLEPASPLSISGLNRTGPSTLSLAKKFRNDSPVSTPRDVCPSRGLSPLRGGAMAASPCKALTSSTGALLKGMASPSRATAGMGSSMNDNNTFSTPSMISFPIDLRRGKLGENRIADAHDLRILYNRLLQWRIVNAKVEHTLLAQKHEAEEPHLESWGLLDRDHCNSVSDAIKALQASIIRLPIVGGARANVHKVQEAIDSAIDIMQAMGSSICSLLMKVEQMNSLVSELSKLSTREHRLLDQCKDLFSTTFIPLQVMHCSMMTQVLQVQRLPTSFLKKA